MSDRCPSCSAETVPGALFCDYCGFDLRNLPAGSAPVAPAASNAPTTPPAPAAAPQPVAADPNACSQCGHVNLSGTAFCDNCGVQLAAPAPAVTPAPEPAPAVVAQPAAQPVQPAAEPAPVVPPVAVAAAAAVSPQPARPVAGFVSGYLLLQASNTKLPIPPGKTVVILGRTDPVSGIYPEIDLEPYNGEDLGVGRDHARLVTQGDQILLVDHHSTNGTALNKVRLKPDEKVPVSDGDEIRMGRLVLVYKVA